MYTVKAVAEKTSISNDYTIFLLMLGISKAIDSINRTKLMDYLEEAVSCG